MSTFECLPFDVIDYILNCENISFIDVCRLASVSKIFNCVAKSNILWKKKYTQMWPYLASLFEAEITDWRQEFHIRYNLKKKVARKLTDLSEEFHHQEHVSNDAFLYFKDISRDHPLGYDMVINELESIIEDSDTHLNLTHRYYSRRALRYMRHVQLENVWRNFLSLPPNKMTLLKGACLVSQWCHATFSKCTSNVESQIDNIVIQVFQKVKEQFPKHPIIKHGLLPGDEVLVKSLWTPQQCKSILLCIMDVMVKDLKFGGTASHAYSAHNIYVEAVLSKKEGLSITLGIIFATVAGKLGVACLPVNFPGYFLLKWLEHPQLEEKDAYSYIDVFDNGSFKTVKDLCDLAPGYESISPSWIEAVPYIKVFIRMTWYIVEFKRQCESGPEDSLSLCSALELLCLLSPDDMEHKLLLARLYMHLGINVTEAISMLQEIAAHDPMSPLIMGYMYQSTLNTLETQKVSRPPVKVKCQVRDGSTDVKFAIGMVMKHKKYGFRCVIYGWDYISTASRDWNQRMGVFKLELKDKQPFYYVLVDDSTTRYAAQENLKIDTKLRAKPINNHRIGRFFESYHGRYYLPNASTLAEYPHDIEAREKALCSLEVE